MAGLYLAEGLAIAIPFLAYRAEGKTTLVEFLLSRPGLMCGGALVALVGTVAYVVQQCRAGIRSGSNQWAFGLAMNLTVVVILVIVAEIGLRVWSVKSNTEERVAGRLLYPRQWDVTRNNFRTILQRAETHPTFWVWDSDLGWTIGDNRESTDGLYMSGVSGIRTATVGQAVRRDSPGCRIAFVGDSFTFGEEVRYEDAWVSRLANELNPRCQVLNFAVGGYGVDQMYLRYMRDIRPWNPDLVVLAFVNHDVVRTLSVYSFLLFPGGETPFAKPRFVDNGGNLTQLNQPLISPEAMFSVPAIPDLPYISYDVNYKWTEWDRPGWQLFWHSYLFRLLISAYPLHEDERPEISETAVQEINTEIFRTFREEVKKGGAKSLIVYLPSVDEVPGRLPWVPIGQKILREGDIPHVDLRDCMADNFTSQMFMPVGRGQHYSPEGNRVAAQCVGQIVRTLSMAQGAQ